LAFHSGREADNSSSSSAEVKEWVELYLHSPNTPSWSDAQWGEHRGQLFSYLLTYLLTHRAHKCDSRYGPRGEGERVK
jgi:hypothetical protein